MLRWNIGYSIKVRETPCDHFHCRFTEIYNIGKIKGLNTPAQPFEPPSIYDWLWGCLNKRQQPPFLTLKDIVSPTTHLPGALDDSPSPKTRKEWWGALTPKTVVLTELFSYMSSAQRSPIEIVQAMVKCGVNSQMLDTFPEGIALPFREAIVRCQEFPPTTSDQKTLELLGRVDLKDLFSCNESRKEYSRLPMVCLLNPLHREPNTE
jgi:anaphase-promoting complex subunit 1